MKIVLLGYGGILGKSLSDQINNIYPVSLREKGWERKIFNSNVIINLIGKTYSDLASKEDYYYANVEVTKIVFREFVKSSSELFIHISSLAALEEFESFRTLKEDDVCYPKSAYGYSKRAAEEWLLSQVLPIGKKIIILRPPMVHGPGDKGNLSLLYKIVRKGMPYPLSSFDNKRSFIAIDNFCFFIEQIIRNHSRMESGIYHIADDEPVSTKRIIEIIKEVTGRKVINIRLPKMVVHVIAKLGDVLPFPLNTRRLKKMTSDLLVSNNKIKEALGIEELPLTAEQGIEKTIRSFEIRAQNY
ncbi:NAD dependent epimerase/dehydratase family protein [compost metagenome]